MKNGKRRSNAVTLVSNSRNEKHIFCSDGIYVWCVRFTLFVKYVQQTGASVGGPDCQVN